MGIRDNLRMLLSDATYELSEEAQKMLKEIADIRGISTQEALSIAIELEHSWTKAISKGKTYYVGKSPKSLKTAERKIDKPLIRRAKSQGH